MNESKKDKNQVLLAASLVGLLALTAGGAAHAAMGEEVPCYGINKCKGAGSCAGANGCAGHNSCAGQGFVKVSKETCLQIQGGSLTPVKKKK